jgi:PAS domain-containing protein
MIEGSAKLPIELITEGERAALLLSAIIDSSGDAIISKDLNGIVTSWNKSAERLFGYTAAEMVGQPITILIPVERQDEEPKILNRLRRGERVDHFQTVRKREEALLASESRFRQLANAMPQMVWTATCAGDLDYVSEQVTRSFRRTAGIGAGSRLAAVGPSRRSGVSRQPLEALPRHWRAL